MKKGTALPYFPLLGGSEICRKDGTDDFADEEIAKLYPQLKHSRSVKILKIERTEQGQSLEGVYRITLEESKEEDIDSLPETGRPRYLKGWLRGMHEVYRVAMKPFHKRM